MDALRNSFYSVSLATLLYTSVNAQQAKPAEEGNNLLGKFSLPTLIQEQMKELPSGKRNSFAPLNHEKKNENLTKLFSYLQMDEEDAKRLAGSFSALYIDLQLARDFLKDAAYFSLWENEKFQLNIFVADAKIVPSFENTWKSVEYKIELRKK